MKLSFAFGLLALCAAASAQVSAYDTFGTDTNVSYFSTVPQTARAADVFTTADAGAGNEWLISQFRITFAYTAAGTYDRRYTVTLYDGLDQSTGATNAFTHTLNSWSFSGTTTTTGVAVSTSTASLGASTVKLKSNTTYGIGVTVKRRVNGVDAYDSTLLLGFKNLAPVAGTGTNGFYLDSNNDGVFAGNEATNGNGWTNGNLRVAVQGSVQAVPEPASMAALGVGALAMLRRRKRA